MRRTTTQSSVAPHAMWTKLREALALSATKELPSSSPSFGRQRFGAGKRDSLPEALALSATQQLPSRGPPSCGQRQRARPSMGRFARRLARKMRLKPQANGAADACSEAEDAEQAGAGSELLDKTSKRVPELDIVKTSERGTDLGTLAVKISERVTDWP